MQYININGQITRADKGFIPIDNGASRYGYGLFETLLVRKGSINLFYYHIERLFSGMSQLDLEFPYLMGQSWLEQQILLTCKRNKLEKLCRVRLQVYAGGGGLFGSDALTSGFIIECFPIAEEDTQLNASGLVLGFAEGMYKSIDTLSNFKSCNALIYALAARKAKNQKWNDALIYNTNKNIIESAIANIFWISSGQVFTPPLSEGCVAGVMRRCLLELMPEIIEVPLTTSLLLQADEIFLTNAIKKIKWVGWIGDKSYTNKIITSLISKKFCI